MIYHPHETNFPQYVKSCCFHLSISVSQTTGCKLLGNLTTTYSYAACTAQMYQGDVRANEGVWLAPGNCRNIYVQTVCNVRVSQTFWGPDHKFRILALFMSIHINEVCIKQWGLTICCWVNPTWGTKLITNVRSSRENKIYLYQVN